MFMAIAPLVYSLSLIYWLLLDRSIIFPVQFLKRRTRQGVPSSLTRRSSVESRLGSEGVSSLKVPVVRKD